MRILYGVVGEGMGHATRSAVVLDDLVGDHEVRIVASGRAHDYLEERFGGASEIWGLTMAYDRNRVRRAETLVRNLRGAVRGWPRNVQVLMGLARDFAPDVVVTDFESLAWLYAHRYRVPLVCVDNIQVLDRCRLDRRVLAGHATDYALARAVVRGKAPGAEAYVVTSWFEAEPSRKRTTVVPSILREHVRMALPERGDHLLVYQTAGAGGLVEALHAAGLECRVYGLRRDLDGPERDGGLTYLPFSEDGFVEDLRTARAVIAGGGFTLMSEAVHLRKPMLSMPIRGQLEQVVNARYLELLGIGRYARRLDAEALRAFVDGLDEHDAAYAEVPRRSDTPAAIATIRRVIEEVAAR